MKRVSYKIMSSTLLIVILTTLVPACFQSLQLFDAEKTTLMLGFPFNYYMIRFAVDNTFAIHFNISGFFANIVVTYFIIALVTKWMRKKAQNSQEA